MITIIYMYQIFEKCIKIIGEEKNMKIFNYENIEIKNVKIIEITIAEEKKVIAKQILVDLPEQIGRAHV